MGVVIGTIGNTLLGKDAFPSKPISEWGLRLLPYTSRLQDDRVLQGGA